jgi:predicted solute-binding protein
VLLAERYQAKPELVSRPPDLEAMLRIADAALVIGDPALHIEPNRLPYEVHDLGGEWVEETGLPMVFAVWAGRQEVVTAELVEAFQQSCRYGRERIDEIVNAEAPRRGLSRELVKEYLGRHIVHELSPRDYEGLRLFLSRARAGLGQSA